MAPQGYVVDAAGFEAVTHIVVLGGATKHPAAQKRILDELEGKWAKAVCWDILGHEQAREKVRYGAIPRPKLHGEGLKLEDAAYERLPGHRPELAVLVLWVQSWEGDYYQVEDKEKDVKLFGGRKRAQRGLAEYKREAVARLYDSESKKMIWQAVLSNGPGRSKRPLGKAKAEGEAEEGVDPVEHLIAVLGSTDTAVRVAAIGSLGRIGDPNGRPGL